jgi:ribulose-5-phosphate 4-epimerase/fuculose-1-phosphate aldolase
MAENAYVGRKFKTEFRSAEPPEDTRIYEVMSLGEKFSKMGMLPKESGGFAGNMSFRNNRGFVITAGGVDKGKLARKSFVQVLTCSPVAGTVAAEGMMEPSSEAMMHYLIYEKRKDVGAIVHVHDDSMMVKSNALSVKSTRTKLPYGTIELAREVTECLGRHSYIVIKGHGVLAAGKSLWEAGRLILTYHESAENV